MSKFNKLKLIGMVFVLIFLAGCPFEDETYVTAEEHYLIGWILHNTDENTPTTLDYSKEDFAVYNYSFNFPSTQASSFYNNIYWIPPKHKIRDKSPSISTSIRFTAPLDRVYYIKGANPAPEQYSSEWTFSNSLEMGYFSDFNKINSEHYLGEDPNNAITPVPGDKKHIYFGKAPYTPTSFIVHDNTIMLNGHLLRGYNNKSYLLREYDEISPPTYQIFLNDELKEEKELIDFDFSKLSYIIDEDGTYKVYLTIQTHYPVWDIIDIEATIIVPNPESQPPELQHIEANPYFIAGEEYIVIVDLYDESGIEKVDLYAEAEFEVGWGAMELVDEEKQIYSASFTPDEDFENFNLGITATDIHGNSVSYNIEPAALPAQTLSFNLEAEEGIVAKGDNIKVRGVCKINGITICDTFLLRHYINDEFLETDSQLYDGSFDFQWTIPTDYGHNDVSITTRYAGTGVYLPYEETITVNILVLDIDIGIFDMEISESIIGEPVIVSANVRNLGFQDIDDALVEFRVDGGLLEEISISDLKAEEEKPVEFEWLPDKEDDYEVELTVIAEDDKNPDNDILDEEVVIDYVSPDTGGFIISDSIKNIVINTEADVEFELFNVGEEKSGKIKTHLYDFFKPEFVFLDLFTGGGKKKPVPKVPREEELEESEEEDDEKETPGGGSEGGDGGKEKEPVISSKRKVTYKDITYTFLAYKEASHIITNVSTDEFEDTLNFSFSDRIKKLQNDVYVYMDFISTFGIQFAIGDAEPIENELGPLDIFESEKGSVKWTPENSGKYMILVFANTSKESNFEDNYFSKTTKVLRTGINIGANLVVDYRNQFIVGDETNITARIANFGTGDAKNIQATLFEQKEDIEEDEEGIDSIGIGKTKKRRIGTKKINALDQKERLDINFSWTPSESGDTILLVIIETKKDINPEDNDDIAFIDVLSEGPDVVSDLSFPKGDKFVNEEITIEGVLFNHGQTDAKGVTAALYEVKSDNRELIENKDIGVLKADKDEEALVDFDWTPTSSGEFFLELVAEAASDDNKDNNEDSIGVEVLVQDFDLEPTIVQYPRFILVNDKAFIGIRLQNFGIKDSPEFNLTLKVNGAYIDSTIFEGLGSEETEFGLLGWLPSAEGTYELEVSVNLTDSNLENNIDKNMVKVFNTKEVDIGFVNKDGNFVERRLFLGEDDDEIDGIETFTIPDTPLDMWIAKESDDGFMASKYINSTIDNDLIITSSYIREPLLQNGLLLYEIFANNDSWNYESFFTFLGREFDTLDIRYTELKAFMCEEYNFSNDKCSKWQEVPSDTLVDRGEFLLTANALQAQAFAMGDADYDGDNAPDWDDDDSDNDGISDSEDTFTCSNGRLKSRKIFNITVNENEDVGKELKGKNKVSIKDKNKKVVEFDVDFDEDNIDCRQVDVEKQPEVTTRGFTLIKGVDLTTKTKTVFVDKIAAFNRVCIKDEEVDSIDEVTQNCDGSNEFLVICDNTTQGNYNCTDIGTQYRVEGLLHSAVAEPTSCEESWTCDDWSSCEDNKQTRTCTETNGCGTNFNRPSEQQSCGEEEDDDDDSSSSRSGRSSRTSLYGIGEIEDWPEGKSKSFMMRTNDMITFTFEDKSHSVVLNSIVGTKIKISVSFNNAFTTFKSGESKNFDIDHDGKDDISISVESITLNRVTVILERINFDFVEKVKRTRAYLNKTKDTSVLDQFPETSDEEIEEDAVSGGKSTVFYVVVTFGILMVIVVSALAFVYFKPYLTREKEEEIELEEEEPKKSDYSEVEAYMLKELNKGFTFKQVTETLKKAGWNDDIIRSVKKDVKERNRRKNM